MEKLTLAGIRAMDSRGMWDMVNSLPIHWENAIHQFDDLDITIDKSKVKNICFAAMGGSASGIELLLNYIADKVNIPMVLSQHYDIPSWVNQDTLFVACSYSGNTEETFVSLKAAQQRNAQIISVCSGGKINIMAGVEGFDSIVIPSDLSARTALPYLFLPILRLFEELGFISKNDEAIAETTEMLRGEQQLLSVVEDSEALVVARQLQDTLPVIYSDSKMLKAINKRWRSQFQENAKVLAYGNLLPEMNHNEIVGWEHTLHLAGRLSVIFLRDKEVNPKVIKRMEITRELLSDQTVGVIEIHSKGNSRLSRLFSLIQMADYTSLYLAFLNGIDPFPIAKIDLLKSKLAEE